MDEFDLLVQGTAIWGLGILDDKRYAAHIARHLDSPEGFIQNAAACGIAVLSGDAAVNRACQDLLAIDISGQIEFFLGKEEDLLLGGGAEGSPAVPVAVTAAKDWWKTHKNDPAYAPPPGGGLDPAIPPPSSVR